MDDFNKMFNISEIQLDHDKKLKKNSRDRQNKINDASKRTRLKKKKNMELMSNHIIKLHSLILFHNNIHESDEIITEILKFDSNILN
jgi:hypothetical protein